MLQRCHGAQSSSASKYCIFKIRLIGGCFTSCLRFLTLQCGQVKEQYMENLKSVILDEEHIMAVKRVTESNFSPRLFLPVAGDERAWGRGWVKFTHSIPMLHRLWVMNISLLWYCSSSKSSHRKVELKVCQWISRFLSKRGEFTGWASKLRDPPTFGVYPARLFTALVHIPRRITQHQAVTRTRPRASPLAIAKTNGVWVRINTAKALRIVWKDRNRVSTSKNTASVQYCCVPGCRDSRSRTSDAAFLLVLSLVPSAFAVLRPSLPLANCRLRPCSRSVRTSMQYMYCYTK